MEENSKVSRPMKKMLFYMGIFFFIILGWYGARVGIGYYFMSHYRPPAITVSTSKAISKKWQSYLSSVGTLAAINGVDLSAEVSGIVKEVRFKSGQTVKKGDVVILLDTEIEKAQLKNNLANLQLAKMNYAREEKLYEKRVTSKASLDQREAELLQAEANVEQTKAQIKQKTITAPFDGNIGIRLVDLGEYVGPGKPLVTLQSLDSLYVNFNLPEQYLPHIKKDQRVEITVNFGKDKTFEGKITAINSKVDQTTRNIFVQATIANPHHKLYPGMFANTKIWLADANDQVVVPQTAIAYSLSGDYVFIVKKEGDDLKAYRQYVKVGERRDGVVAILDGLDPGDEIVNSGQLKLQNGARIEINNSVEL